MIMSLSQNFIHTMVELMKHESGFGKKGVLAYSRHLPQESAKFILIFFIFRRSNCIYEASDIVTLCRLPSCAPVLCTGP